MNKVAKKTQTQGFTLIEILIVIGIIAILAAIVLVAVNPAKNFREAANTQRSANVNAIINAIGQYTVDNKGDLPPGLPTDTDSDVGEGVTEIISENDLTDFEAFCLALVPAYIGAIPVDPEEEDYQAIDFDMCNDADVSTRYSITVDNGHITVTAPNTVDVETGEDDAPEISVTR